MVISKFLSLCSRTGKIASAICAFTLNEIESSIEGEFLKKDKKTDTWKKEKSSIFNGVSNTFNFPRLVCIFLF